MNSAMALIEIGNQAPAFSRPNQDGATVSLDDFAGKYVLLWWYPKADTPG
jgi:peroxiredoxin Q/BCP